MSEFAVGDKVVIDPEFAPAALRGIVFEVTKVNPKNVHAKRADGVLGRGIDYPKYALQPFTGQVVTTVPIPTLFDIGEVVTLKNAWKAITVETPLVVLKDDGGDKVNVCRLGGEGGRYIRMHRGGLVKRDLRWLADALPFKGAR